MAGFGAGQRCYSEHKWGAPSSAGAGVEPSKSADSRAGRESSQRYPGTELSRASRLAQAGVQQSRPLRHLRERSAAADGAPPGSQRAGADSDACAYGRVQHYGGPRAGLHLASAARSAQSGALASRPVVWGWAERSKISTLAQEHKQYKSPAVTNLFSGTNAELVQTPALLQSVTVSRLEATRTKT